MEPVPKCRRCMYGCAQWLCHDDIHILCLCDCVHIAIATRNNVIFNYYEWFNYIILCILICVCIFVWSFRHTTCTLKRTVTRTVLTVCKLLGTQPTMTPYHSRTHFQFRCNSYFFLSTPVSSSELVLGVWRVPDRLYDCSPCTTVQLYNCIQVLHLNAMIVNAKWEVRMERRERMAASKYTAGNPFKSLFFTLLPTQYVIICWPCTIDVRTFVRVMRCTYGYMDVSIVGLHSVLIYWME